MICPTPHPPVNVTGKTEAFAKAKEPYAINRSMRQLQEVLQAVLRPHGEYSPRAFAPLVRSALAHSDPHIRKETDGLVAWAGAFDHIHRMVEEAKNQDADKAREAARWLWKHIADRKNPIAGVEAGIRSLLDSTHVEVAFYASCALRLRYGTDCQDLILPKELPDIELKISLGIGSNRCKFTSRSPMHLDKAQCYKKQKSKPSKIACGVCRGQTALIYTESAGSLTYSRSLDEYQCDDCGAYTMYFKSD